MVITEKTKMAEMGRIMPVLTLANTDLLKECARFPMPVKIRGLHVQPFHSVSFKNLAWLWDITDPKKMMIAITEIFIYPALPTWRKWLNKDSESWANKWIPTAPLIDFYRVVYEINEQIRNAADQFAKIQVKLSEEEKQAGYGGKDPEAVRKMIDSFARRQGIQSLDVAADYPWTHYLFVFKIDADEQNRSRKLSEIQLKKQRKK